MIFGNVSLFINDHIVNGSLIAKRLEFSPPTSEAAGSNLGPAASCWKVGSYLPICPVVYSAVCTGFLHL